MKFNIIYLLFILVNVNSFPLNNIRSKIDLIDDSIYYLLKKRNDLVIQTVKYKKNIYNPEREKEIIDRLNRKNAIDNEFVIKLWTNIFEHSKLLQQNELDKYK